MATQPALGVLHIMTIESFQRASSRQDIFRRDQCVSALSHSNNETKKIRFLVAVTVNGGPKTMALDGAGS
jgi:hypothetical protein